MIWYLDLMNPSKVKNSKCQIGRNIWIGLTSIIFVLLIAGCSSISTATPGEVSNSPCPTCPPVSPVPSIVVTITPEPTITPVPRTLTICLGAEPDTLFYYQSSMLVTNTVWEAIYDGPIDPLGYSYEPVILEKLPNLADGDARIEPVTVQSGDLVVDDAGRVIRLAAGDRVRPFGCNQSECAVIFQGDALEMDELSADFTLLEGLKWSDGEPLTAADAVFSFRIAQQCEESLDWCANHLLAERTADFIDLDDRTTRWTGLPGNLDPKYMANFFHPLPVHQLQGMSLAEMAEVDQGAMAEAEQNHLLPAGWGSYMLENWEIGNEIRLSKNPNFFRAEEGLPRFDNLVFRFTGEDPIFNISRLLSGECDLVEQDAGLKVVLNLLIGMDELGLLQAHIVNGNVWEHFDFSLMHADYDDGYQAGSDRPDIFGDVRTRQAIAMCLDRQKVIDEAIYQLSDYKRYYLSTGDKYYVDINTGQVPDSYIPAEHPLYNSEISQYEYSPSKAKALLEEVGWIDHDGDSNTPRQAQSVAGVPDGTLLEFNYWTTTLDIRQQIAPILANSLSACGIKANIRYWNAAEFYELPTSPVFSRNYDVVEFASLTGFIPPCELFLSENIPGDPEEINTDGTQRFPRGWEGQNNSGYSSADFDQACESASALLPGQPGYIENHMLAQEIFTRDLPVVPLFQRIKVTATGADLCGYWMDPTADSDTWNIEEFGYGEECGK
jgi:peptide/nickel transport system substrate-binding protein